MKFTTRHQANEFYSDISSDAKKTGTLLPTWNHIGRQDLFFLLTKLLNRPDLDRDWLFDRCKEVQQDPDWRLDLWAREHYKSTIITFGKSIQDILDSHSDDGSLLGWDREVTIGIFSHTKPIAKDFIAMIEREFRENNLLKEVYPDVLWREPRREAPLWSIDKGIIVKRNSNPREATVEAHGVVDGQPIGKHFVILVYDDVVTEESVYTTDQIEKTTKRWALSTNLGADGGVERYIGTRYHYNDTYAEIMKREAAKPRLYPAREGGKIDGKPVFLTEAKLAAKRRKQGPYVFACQMLQDPKQDSVQGFNMDWLKSYRKIVTEGMNLYLLCDPAGEKKRENDYTVMTVIGLAEDNNYYLVDGIRDRLNLTERTKKLMELHRKWRPLKTGYEKYGKDSDIEHIEYVMEEENYRFEITPLGGSMPKNDRIRKLVPVFEQGRFYLPVKLPFFTYDGQAVDFIEQFIKDEYDAFPVAVHDDMLDDMARIMDPEFGATFPEQVDPIEAAKYESDQNRQYDPYADMRS